MIYTRFGSEVKLTASKTMTIYQVRRSGRIDTYEEPPKKLPKNAELTEIPHCWYVKGEYAEGGLMRDGEWCSANELRADDGIREIQNECRRLNPAAAEAEAKDYGVAA